MGGVILIFIFIGILIFAGIQILKMKGKKYDWIDEKDETYRRKVMKGPRDTGIIVILAIVGFFLLVTIIKGIVVVPAGFVYVKFNKVSGDLKALDKGMHLIVPYFNTVYPYDIRRQEYTMSVTTGEGRRQGDDSIWSPTKDGIKIGIDLTIWYKLKSDMCTNIHENLGPNYDEQTIRAAVRRVIREVVANYGIMEVYSEKRKELADVIFEQISEILQKDGFFVEEVHLRDVVFTQKFARALEEKQIAEQEAKKMEYVLEKERKEKERKEIYAEGEAIQIKKIQAALHRSPDYINYLYVQKLSEKISVIVSDQQTIMDLKGMIK